MARLGSEKRPIWARVQSMERAEEIMALCNERGWKATVGIEPDKPEDISDVDRALNPPEPSHAAQIPGRNEPCLCGSGTKYKKCCGAA
jgi:SWIM/SEC-C metal-binding protein